MPRQDHLGKAGGGLMAAAFCSAVGYLIASNTGTPTPTPSTKKPPTPVPGPALWPYALCGALFVVGLILYGAAHGWLPPWQTRRALKRRAMTTETALEGARAELAGVRLERDEARCELEAAHRPVAVAPAAINGAEWEATCDESGEFPDSKALVFGLWHRFRNPAARLVFGDLRCTVTDPDQITTTATGTASYYQYINYFFQGAPPVRPGLYLFRWQGRKSNGEWVHITDGEHMVNGSDLIVTIMKSRFENWKRIALIAALRVKITNTTEDMIRLSTIGFTCDPEGKLGLGTTLSADERLEIDRELYARRERQHYGISLHNHATIPAHESISGWVVEGVTRDPAGGTPRCTVVIKDELGNEYRATLPMREPQTAD